MNCSVSTYQQLLATLLFVAYLVGNLSLPIFEGVHFLLHLGDDTTIHSFQSHNGIHQHEVLDFVNQLTTNSSTSNIPNETSTDNKFKKIAQPIINTNDINYAIKIIKSTNFTTNHSIYVIPYIPLFAPPPEV